MTERWAAVAGYEGHYEVSSHGRVRGLDRMVKKSRGAQFWRGRILRPARRGSYLSVVLCAGDRRTFYVHRLVAAAFVGGEGEVCRHLDGDCTNNHAENLAWGTSADNMADARRHGTMVIGEDKPAAKLTESTVRLVRTLYAMGDTTQRELGAAFGVSHRTIGEVVRRERWTHVE